MKILVIGGTRFFGIHMVNKLLELGIVLQLLREGMLRIILEIEFLGLYLKEQVKLS